MNKTVKFSVTIGALSPSTVSHEVDFTKAKSNLGIIFPALNDV